MHVRRTVGLSDVRIAFRCGKKIRRGTVQQRSIDQRHRWRGMSSRTQDIRRTRTRGWFRHVQRHRTESVRCWMCVRVFDRRRRHAIRGRRITCRSVVTRRWIQPCGLRWRWLKSNGRGFENRSTGENVRRRAERTQLSDGDAFVRTMHRQSRWTDPCSSTHRRIRRRENMSGENIRVGGGRVRHRSVGKWKSSIVFRLGNDCCTIRISFVFRGILFVDTRLRRPLGKTTIRCRRRQSTAQSIGLNLLCGNSTARSRRRDDRRIRRCPRSIGLIVGVAHCIIRRHFVDNGYIVERDTLALAGITRTFAGQRTRETCARRRRTARLMFTGLGKRIGHRDQWRLKKRPNVFLWQARQMEMASSVFLRWVCWCRHENRKWDADRTTTTTKLTKASPRERERKSFFFRLIVKIDIGFSPSLNVLTFWTISDVSMKENPSFTPPELQTEEIN